MENASKALLMAGGFLAAILVVTSLTIMWSKMSSAKASQSGNVKTEQLAEFNAAFDSYANETVMGTDIISLFNRVNSYDQNIENDILLANIQYEGIDINVDISSCGEQLKKDFKNALGLDPTKGINLLEKTAKPYDKIKKYVDYEKKYGKDVLSKLATYYNSVEHNGIDPFCEYTEVGGKVSHPIVKQVCEEKKLTKGSPALRNAVIEKIVGKKTYIGDDLKKDNSIISDYSTFTAFKTTKFSCEEVGYSDKNGQVKFMNFKAKS